MNLWTRREKNGVSSVEKFNLIPLWFKTEAFVLPTAELICTHFQLSSPRVSTVVCWSLRGSPITKVVASNQSFCFRIDFRFRRRVKPFGTNAMLAKWDGSVDDGCARCNVGGQRDWTFLFSPDRTPVTQTEDHREHGHELLQLRYA